MKKETKENIRDGPLASLVGGFVVGFVDGFLPGFLIGFLVGLGITFITQLIAYFQNSSDFSLFSLVVSLILIVITQSIGWYIVKKINKEAQE